MKCAPSGRPTTDDDMGQRLAPRRNDESLRHSRQQFRQQKRTYIGASSSIPYTETTNNYNTFASSSIPSPTTILLLVVVVVLPLLLLALAKTTAIASRYVHEKKRKIWWRNTKSGGTKSIRNTGPFVNDNFARRRKSKRMKKKRINK